MNTEITISQALRKIADIKGQLKKHLANAASNVQWDVRNTPAFDFVAELQAADALSNEMLKLQGAVAIANATHKVSLPGKGYDVPLACAVRRLEEIKSRISWYEGLSVNASETKIDESFEYTEVGGTMQRVKIERRYQCSLPEAKREAAVRTLQEEFNALNDEVEKINHRTDIKPI